MKNILILSNFESYSTDATTYAMNFFSGQSCHFYFSNIVKVWEYTTDNLMTASKDETIYDTILSSSKSKLKKTITNLENTYTDEAYTFTALIDYDVFTDAIKQAVKAYDIDCILMGSNGKSDFIERLFGSHSTRVVRKVDCPVFIIPDNYEYTPLQKVLLVLDQKNVYSKACEYAIRSLIFITMKSTSRERVHLDEISKVINSPSTFTAKILQKLVKTGIILSVKEPRGGFQISEEVSVQTKNIKKLYLSLKL